MDKLFNDDFGEYIPGFFLMKLNFNLHENFEWEEFKEEDKATIIHEYIHYLQDISTTHGIANFNFIAQIINLYLYKIATSESNEFTVPIDLEKCKVKDAYQQAELMSIYKGEDIHKKIHHVTKISREIEDIYADEFKLDKDSKNNVYNINIYFNDEEMPYRFGSKYVLESMAYLIENYMHPTQVRKNEFPYNACEMVCEYLYPEIASKVDCIVAMCDLALMHYHSGDFFYELVLNMKLNKILPKNAFDVYEYTIQRIPHLFEDYIKSYEEMLNNVDILFPLKMEQSKKTNIFLKNILKKAQQYRFSKPNFIAKLLELKNMNNKKDEYFLKLMNIFEIPMIIDKNNEIYGSNKDNSCMVVPIALEELFTKGNSFECYLYNFCKVRKNELLCENCLDSPWEQAKKKKLCPLGLYWYHYSMEGKSLKHK